MAKLQDIFGGIMTQIVRGRIQADLATLEVARVYKDHPSKLLRDFPIPKLALDEVIVDLKMAIAATPVPEYFLAPESKTQILSKFKEMLDGLQNRDRGLESMIKRFPEMDRYWRIKQEELSRSISKSIPTETEIDPDAIANTAAALIRSHLTVSMQEAKVPLEDATAFAEAERKWAGQIKDIIHSTLKAQPSTADRIDVLITAAELENIPLEKISSMRFTLRESDRTWTEYETEQGEKVQKLIPG